MKQAMGRGGWVAILVLGFSAATAAAQDRASGSPVAARPRFSLEGSAGIQTGYGGSMQSLAFGFAPTRSLTLLVSAERSHIPGKVEGFVDGYSVERGGTEQFVSAELRCAFLPGKRVSPYVLGGGGRGISRPNVNAYFPNAVKHDIQVAYYGAGVRIPIQSRLEAFVDTRFIVTGNEVADTGIYFPVRAGLAWRF
jgi:hypothetical protein